MEKPFDPKALEASAKEVGLPEVEDMAEKMLKVVCDWSEASFKLIKNPLISSLGLSAVSFIRNKGQELADKIDGKEG